jgi:hypothetical protein
MSLKSFHLVFISASVLLALFLAAWCFGAGDPGGPRTAAGGLAALLGGGGLVGYEAWFLRRTRGLR